MHISVSVFQFLQKGFKYFFELERVPIDDLRVSDNHGLERIDGLLPELSLGTAKAEFKIDR